MTSYAIPDRDDRREPGPRPGNLPLSDLRIVAVEQFGAGPFGSLHLADLGADVIKIEDPSTGGDVSRYVPPFRSGEDSLFFETFNRNKRSISIDLGTNGGRAVFEEIVRHSDAVYSNLRGDVPERLGLTYGSLAAVNPRIVCCSLSAFGMTGPRSGDPGYDYLLQGLCGWMDICGEPGGPPTKTGLSLVDFSGGLVAALALVTGVHQARRDGLGMDCDVSLYDTALSLLTYLGTWTLNNDYEPTRTHHSAHPSLVPFQNVPTSDGWIVVACAKEKFWRRLCVVLGHPEWSTDARYESFDARAAHRDEIVALIEQAFSARTSEDWLDRLADAGVPCAPVLTVDRALADPHAVATRDGDRGRSSPVRDHSRAGLTGAGRQRVAGRTPSGSAPQRGLGPRPAQHLWIHPRGNRRPGGVGGVRSAAADGWAGTLTP